jgi:hypothetical protein
MAPVRRKVLLLLLTAPLAWADIAGCVCDPASPEGLRAQACSLTNEAIAQPAGPLIFFVRDTNPKKANRWLAVPQAVRRGVYTLRDIAPEERLRLWTAAIGKAKQLWGDQWGLAYNSDSMRTQCQPHLHIGKLLPGVETGKFVVVSGPGRIPVPADGTGLWVHPRGANLHVHLGEQLTETVLLR